MITLDRYGIKAIAIFEGIKGMLVLALVLTFIVFFNSDAHALAEILVRKFHIDPDGHYTHMLLMLATTFKGPKLMMVCACAFLYSTIKISEAYGLWRQRNWGRTLGIASNGVLIPYEIYEVIHLYTHVKLIILLINTAIVLYLFRHFNKPVAIAGRAELQT